MDRHREARFLKVSAMGALFLLGGCKAAVMDPKGPVGEYEKLLILLAIIVMALVVVPVIIMTLLFAYKYRASNKDADYQPEWSFSHKIELIVWGIPALITLALCVICWISTHELDPARPLQLATNDKAIEIDVIALDWKWLFIYPDQHIAAVNEVAIPVGVPVRFVITSDTVMNSFFIPQLGSQIYAMTGMRARLNLLAKEAGTYDGLSANFSGAGFSGMHFETLALPPAEFGRWIADVQKSDDKMDQTSYRALAEPSEYNTAHVYADIDPGLFNAVVDKYMDMPMSKDGSMRPSMPAMGKGAE